jgi:hypothetical protein
LKRRSSRHVVELAEAAQRPELGAALAHGAASSGSPALGPAHGEARRPRRRVDAQGDVTCSIRLVRSGPRAGARATPGPERAGAPPASACAFSGTRSANRDSGTVSSTSRHSTARRPFTPLAEAAEDVGEVAPHLALVHDARQAAGAGQHGQQRDLGQAHRGRGVVHQQDLVAGERQLVPAAAHAPFTAARNFSAEWREASSIASRVSFVYLQKLTLKACVEEPSM